MPVQQRTLEISFDLSEKLRLENLLASFEKVPGPGDSFFLRPPAGTWEESPFFADTLRALEDSVVRNGLLGGDPRDKRVAILLRVTCDAAGRTLYDLGDTHHARTLEIIVAKFGLFLWLVDNSMDQWRKYLASPAGHDFIESLTDLYLDALTGGSRGEQLLIRVQYYYQALMETWARAGLQEQLPKGLLKDFAELGPGPQRLLLEIFHAMPEALPWWSNEERTLALGLFLQSVQRHLDSRHFELERGAELIDLMEYRMVRLNNSAMEPWLLLSLFGVMMSHGMPPEQLSAFARTQPALWQRIVVYVSMHVSMLNDMAGLVKDVFNEYDDMNACVVVARYLLRRDKDATLEDCIVEATRVVAQCADGDLHGSFEAIREVLHIDEELAQVLLLTMGSVLAGLLYWLFGEHAAPRYSQGFSLIQLALKSETVAQQLVKDLLSRFSAEGDRHEHLLLFQVKV